LKENIRRDMLGVPQEELLQVNSKQFKWYRECVHIQRDSIFSTFYNMSADFIARVEQYLICISKVLSHWWQVMQWTAGTWVIRVAGNLTKILTVCIYVCVCVCVCVYMCACRTMFPSIVINPITLNLMVKNTTEPITSSQKMTTKYTWCSVFIRGWLWYRPLLYRWKWLWNNLRYYPGFWLKGLMQTI
jgi:hypothetical protein